MRVLLLICLQVLVLWGGSALFAADPELCLECHDVVAMEEFTDSVHGANGCVSCHVELTDIDAHMEGELFPDPVDCSRCHQDETNAFTDSVHSEMELGCVDCHAEIHTQSTQGEKLQANYICPGMSRP